MNPNWLSTIVTIVVSLVTLGVTWGVLKTSVTHMTKEVDRLRDTTEKHSGFFETLRADFASLHEEVRVALAVQESREAGKMTAERPRRRKLK